MEIVHVISSLAPQLGGPSQACLAMGQALAQRGHKVSIHATDLYHQSSLPTRAARIEEHYGVRIYRYPLSLPPRLFNASLSLYKGLDGILSRADIVHLHSLYLFHDWATKRLCTRHAVPYLLRPHGSLDPYMWSRGRIRKSFAEALFQNSVTRHAAVLHYTTEEEKRLATPYSLGVPGVVIPLGVSVPDNLPAHGFLQQKYPEIGSRKVIIYFGRVNFKKGLDILSRAFGQLLRQRQDVHLVIAGPDDEGYGDKVRGWLYEGRALEHTTFTGMLSGFDKWAALRDANIFVLPSYSENFGIAVVEAMACGLPVVISNKVNIWREVESAGAGIVIGCNAEECTQAMAWLLDHPREAREMGAKGAAFVRERFNWSTVGAQLEDVYSRIISGTL